MDGCVLLLVITELVGARPGSERYARIAAVAPVIVREATRAAQDPLIIGAVIHRESAFNRRALGRLGEIGLMQIMPGTARAVCPELLPHIWEPWANIRCGIRLLDRAERACGGEPGHWLGRYNGRACGPSGYAQRVLTFAGHDKRPAKRRSLRAPTAQRPAEQAGDTETSARVGPIGQRTPEPRAAPRAAEN